MGLLDKIGTLLGMKMPNASIVDTGTLVGRSVSIVNGMAEHINEIGTYQEYREMRAGPTIALVRAVTTSAIRSADWMVESDDDVDDEIVAEVKTMIDELRPELLRNMVLSLDYGFQVIQLVWTTNAAGNMVIEWIKPIKPENVKKINVYESNGKLASVEILENGKPRILQAQEVLLTTYDGEGGDPFGRSRHENIRIYAWYPWRRAVQKNDSYMTKAAGVIPIIKYPMGDNLTADGQVITNSEIANRLLDNLPMGKGIALPTVLMNFAADALKQGAKIDDLMAWKIEYLDCKSGFGAEVLATMKHFEALQMRGWLCPERAAIEGTSGTKAEAEAHQGVMIDTAQEDASGFCREINRQIVDRYIVQNYGESYRGKVRVKATAIADDRRATLDTLAMAILTNPANIEIVERIVDMDALMDQVDIPKREKVVDIAENPAIEGAVEPTPEPPNETVKLSRAAKALATFMRKQVVDV